MKTLTETLENHKSTSGYATSEDIKGYVPEIGETVYDDNQSMTCNDIEINGNGFVTVVFNNGVKVSGIQVAEMTTAGIIKIKK
jgi:hypothetical protein